MIVGLDFHGVCNKYSKFFSELSQLLVSNNHQVHIITGHKITPEFIDQINNLGIHYTHLFSIVDYHEKIGTEIHYNEKGPWIDADIWNRTKAEYCERSGINFHIDDSDEYGKYFKNTGYLQLLQPK